MRTTVVIPTYNEQENIVSLLESLGALGHPDLSILVVDDSSPDGTAAAVRAVGARDPRVHLLLRPRKEGLGRAYSAAFQHLLDPVSSLQIPDAIVQMDADFSHNPADLPRLLAALDTADLVVGSRYVPGGGTINWPIRREALSRTANRVARSLTRTPIRDLTGGFIAWRVDLLHAVEPWTITADGYGYLVELKVRAARLGARCAEVPIIFTERRSGQSKLSKRVIVEAMGVVGRLSLTRGRRAVRSPVPLTHSRNV